MKDQKNEEKVEQKSTKQEINVNVSGYNNNCGLYALALGIKLELINQPNNLTNIPECIKQIKPGEVQPGADSETLKSIGNTLRKELREALSQDESFKQRRLENFIQLCILTLIDRGHSSLYEIDMEAFYLNCYPFINQLNVLLLKELNLLKKHKITLLEKSLPTLLSKIKEIMQGNVADFTNQLNNLFGEIATCQDLYDKCYQFNLAWNKVKEVEFSEKVREMLKHAAETWFYEKSMHLLNQSDKTANRDEFYKCLYQLSISYNKMIGLNEPTEAAKYLLARFYVLKAWEQQLYPHYLDYLSNDPVQLSADELGCLAQYWKVALHIDFGNDRPSYETTPHSETVCTVRLHNPSKNHWQVLTSSELLSKFDQDGKIKAMQEKGIFDEDQNLKPNLFKLSSIKSKMNLSSFRYNLPVVLLPSDYKKERGSQAECLQQIAIRHGAKLAETKNYLRVFKDSVRIIWAFPKFIELFKLEPLFNSSFAVPVLESTSIKTAPELPNKVKYLFCVINWEEYNFFDNDQLFIHYIKNVAVAMQDTQKADPSIAGASLLLKGRVPVTLLTWLRGSTPLDPSPVPDVEILYGIPVDINNSEEYIFMLKQGGKYRLCKRNNDLISTIQGKNILKRWSEIRSRTIIDYLIEGSSDISDTFEDFITNFWRAFFNKFDYEKDSPDWELFLSENNDEELKKIVGNKVDDVIRIKKEEIFNQLKESLIKTTKYYLNKNLPEEIFFQVKLFEKEISKKNHDIENLQQLHTMISKVDLKDILKKINDCILAKKDQFFVLSAIGETKRHVDDLLDIIEKKENIIIDVLARCRNIAQSRKRDLNGNIFDLSYPHIVLDSINKKDYQKNFDLIETIDSSKLDSYNDIEYLYESAATLHLSQSKTEDGFSVNTFISRFNKIPKSINKHNYLSYTFAQIINLFVQFETLQVKTLFKNYFENVLKSPLIENKQHFFKLMGDFFKTMKSTKLKYEYAKENHFNQTDFKLQEFCKKYFMLKINKEKVEPIANPNEVAKKNKLCDDFLYNKGGFDLEFYCLEFFLLNEDKGELKDALKYRDINFKEIMLSMKEVLEADKEKQKNSKTDKSTIIEEVNEDQTIDNICKAFKTTLITVDGTINYIEICQMIVGINANRSHIIERADKIFNKITELCKLLPKENNQGSTLYIYDYELRKDNVVKFIYVLNQDDKICVDHEKIQENNSQRSAHSELAKGLSVKAAGEIVFYKNHKSEIWKLIEINNGSGHYRPDASLMLELAKIAIVNSLNKDINISSVRLINSLRPGMGLGSGFRAGLTYPILSKFDSKSQPQNKAAYSTLMSCTFWKGVGIGIAVGGVIGVSIARSKPNMSSKCTIS